MDGEHEFTSVLELPPALAAAIVQAQQAAETLRRDGKGDKGKYTTSDAIAAEAGRALNSAGAAWARLGVSLHPPKLAQSDIGKQEYVGDLVQEWIICHESGPAVRGCSRMPVIVSRGRPHDKAVGASLTYDVGAVLRGALCMERENKDAIDRRQDDRPQGPPPERRTPTPREQVISQVDRVARELRMNKGAAWSECLAAAELPGDLGGNDGPGSSDVTDKHLEALLRASHAVLGAGVSDPPGGSS